MRQTAVSPIGDRRHDRQRRMKEHDPEAAGRQHEDAEAGGLHPVLGPVCGELFMVLGVGHAESLRRFHDATATTRRGFRTLKPHAAAALPRAPV